ncbi:MAG TPA: GTP cyclohydrolase I FolE [Chloroflexota bacterium]
MATALDVLPDEFNQSSQLRPIQAAGEWHVLRLLEELGEDPQREGLLRTPQRVWQALTCLTDGYAQEAIDVVGDALFEEQYDEMVVTRDIEFYSLCEHHLLPFFGRVHIGYIPDGKVVGLSKLPRVVDVYSHRLQLQERLTVQIATGLEEALEPRGVGVVLEASHLCLMMRGVEKQSSRTMTSSMRGLFKSDDRIRDTLLDLVHRS